MVIFRQNEMMIISESRQSKTGYTTQTLMEKNLLLESKLESLHLIERTIDEITDKCKLEERYYGNILIASLESVQNAISHGNRFDPGKFVEVTMKIGKGKLIVTTKDEGDGFDFNNVPDPTARVILEISPEWELSLCADCQMNSTFMRMAGSPSWFSISNIRETAPAVVITDTHFCHAGG
jgi:anti-sigma regulatory factor (Ser/Thr protein kinase)